MRRRVVITGVGTICSLGSTGNEVWRNALQGQAPVSPIPEHWHDYAEFRSTVWSPLPEIDFAAQGIPRIEILRSDPVSLLTFLAAREALGNAGFSLRESDANAHAWEVPALDPERTVIFMGSSVGGVQSMLQNSANHLLLHKLKRLDSLFGEAGRDDPEGIIGQARRILAEWSYPKRFNNFIIPMLMPNAVSAYLGIKFSLKGHNNTISLACASGSAAIGHAFRAIADGRADTALCGGSEYLDDGYGGAFRGFDVAGTLATHAVPGQANRPFDKARNGFLFSEGGAAVLVLEEYEAAVRRQAPIIAEVCGYAETFDAYSMLRSAPDGVQACRLLDTVLADAGITAGQIDYLNAHGTGTELNDQIEADVIRRYFGHGPRVNATKSLTGHSIGAAGAIEAAITAWSLQRQTTHGCRNLDDPIVDLDFVREPGPETFTYGLSQSFAFGGHNVALVFKRPD